ncbi:hypothetical protein CLV24_12255 [Pontibacter ummariensis]|uniref:SpoIIAA-like n=2 Tax=Pontibacter ummariensis TaxID=1610492 RepID=A0A239JLU7_9BACT|nr:hypothetical protein CLV24_12255 [Pontibacter ummariensis]SNT06388.1 hypothetical protein SAMN06296052_12255 [Pontibacter ummariensis]
MTAFERTELPYLHIAFRQDLDVLFCRWRAAVDLSQFAEGYMTTLEIATRQQAHFWLQDFRLRNVSSELEQAWFESSFVPAVKIALGNSTCIAYLMSPLQRELSLSDAFISLRETVRYGNHLTTAYFVSEHDALDWLNQCRLQAISR